MRWNRKPTGLSHVRFSIALGTQLGVILREHLGYDAYQCFLNIRFPIPGLSDRLFFFTMVMRLSWPSHARQIECFHNASVFICR